MSDNILGSLIGLIGIILALVTHMIIKELTFDVDFLMILFGRFVFSLPLLFIFALVARNKELLKVNNWLNVILRSIFGLITMLLVFLSLQLIPIGLVTALAQSSAIFVTILAPTILGEKIGIKRWIAVLIGLFGVYLMTNPIGIINGTSNLSSLGLTLATISAITHAGLALILRKLGKTEHPTTTALIHNCIISLFVVCVLVFFGSSFIGQKGTYDYQILFNPNYFLIILIILGLIGSFVQYFMATSYKYAEATILVTLRYIAIPLAGIFGYFIWEEIPTSNQIFGAMLIIFSCLFITIREVKTKRNH